MKRSEWATAWLQRCNFPVTSESVLACIAWCESERSHNLPPTGAEYNPFDTEQPWPNSTDFNSAGVKNYATLDDGLDATKATIFNGFYNNLVGAFKTSQTADAICDALRRTPWGSKPDQGMVNAVRANESAYDVDINAPGTPDNPSPPQPPPNGDDMPLSDSDKAWISDNLAQHLADFYNREWGPEGGDVTLTSIDRRLVAIEQRLGIPTT